MKICILSDIHGNYEALKECVNEAKKLNIRKFFCLGDYVGYYYEPHKCIDLLNKIKAICIKGNHENIFLEILNDNKKIEYYKEKYGNGIKIAFKRLKKKHIEFIKKLPKTKKINLNGKKILLCHGSPWNTDEYIYPNKFNKFKNNLNRYKYDYIFLGHTHIQMNKKINKKIILNPGSVGQPRDKNPTAKWLIIDLDKKKFDFKESKFNRFKVLKQVNFYDKNKKILTKHLQK